MVVIVDFVVVGLCVVVALLAVAVTALWQRQRGLETRVTALEDEIGVPWAERRLDQTVIRRVMTLEILWALRRSRPKRQ